MESRISPNRTQESFYNSETSDMFQRLKARYATPTNGGSANKTINIETANGNTNVHVESFESRVRRPESPAARSMFQSTSRSGLIEVNTRPASHHMSPSMNASRTLISNNNCEIEISTSPPPALTQRILSAERRLTELEEGLRTASQLPVRLSSVVRDLEHRVSQNDNERRAQNVALEDATRELGARLRDMETRMERKDLEVKDLVFQLKKQGDMHEAKLRELMNLVENFFSESKSTQQALDSRITSVAEDINIHIDNSVEDLRSLIAATDRKVFTQGEELKVKITESSNELHGALSAFKTDVALTFEKTTEETDIKVHEASEAATQQIQALEETTKESFKDVTVFCTTLQEKDAEIAGDLAAVADRVAAIEERIAANEEKAEAVAEELQNAITTAATETHRLVQETREELASKIAFTANQAAVALEATASGLEGQINELTASTKQSFEDVSNAVADLTKKDEDLAAAIEIAAVNHDSLNRRHEETVASHRALTARVADIRDDLSDTKSVLAAQGEDLKLQIATVDAEQRAATKHLREDTIALIEQTASNAEAAVDAARLEAAEATAALQATTEQSFQDVQAFTDALKERADVLDTEIRTVDERVTSVDANLAATNQHLEESVQIINESLEVAKQDNGADLAEARSALETAIHTASVVAGEKLAAAQDVTNAAISDLKATTRQSFDDVRDTVDALRARDEELDNDIRTVSGRVDTESSARKAEIRTAVGDASARTDLNLAEVRRNLRENIVQECNTLSLAIRDLASATDDRLARISDRVSVVSAQANTPKVCGPSPVCLEVAEKVRMLGANLDSLDARQDKTASQLSGYMETSINDVKRAFERTQTRQMEQMEAVNGVLDLVASEVDSLKARTGTTVNIESRPMSGTSISVRSPPRFGGDMNASGSLRGTSPSKMAASVRVGTQPLNPTYPSLTSTINNRIGALQPSVNITSSRPSSANNYGVGTRLGGTTGSLFSTSLNKTPLRSEITTTGVNGDTTVISLDRH